MEINMTDPAELNFLEESEIFASVYDTLFTHQIAKGFEPVLANSWTFDNQNKTISFFLKSNLKFSDGTPLDAYDVEASFKRLILLDESNSLTLSKCLQKANIKFKDINHKHELINVKNKHEIILGPTDCGESILREIGDPNYGIISRVHIEKNFKLSHGHPVSGPFIFKKTDQSTSLIPNLHNWRWKDINERNLKINFLKTDKNFESISKNKIDFFRTSEKNLFNLSVISGYEASMSVPIMTWFLTFDQKQSKRARPILEHLNFALDRENYEVFQDNKLEFPAKTFFPREFNCGHEVKLIQTGRKQPGKLIQLINHRSNESEIYVKDLKKDLEKNGYKVLVDDERNNSKTDPVKLYLRRQFLGDGTQSTLNFLFRTVKSIADTDKTITKNLERLDQAYLTPQEKNNLLSQTCKFFSFYNHMAIAHRKYAFLTKSKEFLKVFSKANGNLQYTELIYK